MNFQISGIEALGFIAWTALVAIAAVAFAVAIMALRRAPQPSAQADGERSRAPDLLLMSEDSSPIGVKFDGEAKSLFEAMMRNMSEDYERARAEISSLTAETAKQRDAILTLSSALASALEQFKRHGQDSDLAVQRLAQSLDSSAKTLLGTHQRAAAQIDKLVPYMQERAAGMAEITTMAGAKVTQVLQTLLQAGQEASGTVKQAGELAASMAASSSQLGEKLFSATNMVQSGGKKLAETLESIRAGMGAAASSITRSEEKLDKVISAAEQRLAASAKAGEAMISITSGAESCLRRIGDEAERISDSASCIEQKNDLLNEHLATASQRMESVAASFDAAQRSMGEASGQVRHSGGIMNALLQDLRANAEQVASNAASGGQAVAALTQQVSDRLQTVLRRMDDQTVLQCRMTEERIAELATSGTAMAQQANASAASLAQSVNLMRAENERIAAVRAKFAETIEGVGERLERQSALTLGRAEYLAEGSFAKLGELTESVEGIVQRLNMLGQLTGTLGNVAGQLGQLVPAIDNLRGGSAPQSQPQVIADFPSSDALRTELSEEMRDQWNKAVVQIEAMHDQLAQMMVQQKDQLEMRLMVMDKKLRGETPAPQAARDDGAMARQTSIMNEMIIALSKINDRVAELDDRIQTLRDEYPQENDIAAAM